jgi:UDP-2,4-diacetamido-2,4,6-trideoxy-beta-L-altropyranose hydrolase
MRVTGSEIMLNLTFRVDGNRELGMGHVSRCLVLARALKALQGIPSIRFITLFPQGRRMIESSDFPVIQIDSQTPQKILTHIDDESILVTDFLDTDLEFIQRLRPHVKYTVCIDNNVIPKVIPADILINANVFNWQEEMIVDGTHCFFGPKYMPLREEFEYAKRKSHSIIQKQVNNLLVLFGGTDPKESTRVVLDALAPLPLSIAIKAVFGPGYTGDIDKLTHIYKQGNISIIRKPDNLHKLMEMADIAITAAGITLYELAYLGIPSIVLPQAEHQEGIASAFERAGACIRLRMEPDNNLIYETTIGLIESIDKRRNLSDGGKALVDGKGRQRIVDIIKECL